MLNNLRDIATAKIIVRHELKVRVNLRCKIGRKPCGYRALQTFTFDLCLFIVGLLVRQEARGFVKQFPNQRFFPIRPRLRACTLAVRQRKQHQCVQVFLVFHNVGKVCDRRRIIKISLLCNLGKREVMIDEQDERFALFGR